MSIVDRLEGFYKDLGLMGGFVLLFITGPGKYSIEALLGSVAPYVIKPTIRPHVVNV